MAIQLIPLRDLWRQVSGFSKLGIAMWGAVALCEAALPLTGALASGLAYGRLRQEGALLAFQMLGHRPAVLFLPAALLGGLLSAFGLFAAQSAVPRSLSHVQSILIDALQREFSSPGEHLFSNGAMLFQTEPVNGANEVIFVDGAKPYPTVIRAEAIRLEGERLVLKEAWIYGSALQAHVGRVALNADAVSAQKKLKAFGPPNATPSAELDRSLHHRFIYHRRIAMPALAFIWSLLGAILGASYGGIRALLGSVGLIAFAYGLFRAGELNARAGFCPIWWGAYAPLFLMTAVCLWCALRMQMQLAEDARG